MSDSVEQDGSGGVYRVKMIGLGTVGAGVAELLRDQAGLYAERLGKSVALVGVLVRDKAKAVGKGVVKAELITDDAEAFFGIEADAVIEVAGGVEPVGRYVERALRAGCHVVTANKTLLAERGGELFGLAREHGVAIAFEASCGGGIPCVNALMNGLMANRIDGLFGILNGTCNFILTQMAEKGQGYDEALKEAQALGFAEADPTADVSGADAAQKLAILASLAFGAHVPVDAITTQGIDELDAADLGFARELGYTVKLLATAERWPGQEWVCLHTRPCFVKADDPLALVGGSFNALSVYGHAVGHTLYYGRGAGALPTASAVVADVLGVASGAVPAAFAGLRLTPDLKGPAKVLDPDETESRWYVRLTALDVPGVVAGVTRALGDKGISLASLLQHEADEGEPVPVVVLTHEAALGDVKAALVEIAGMKAIVAEPVLIRIVDPPVG
ncbi:MAG: homoserine dehydrogenase [Planctomycetota bacterium]